MNSKLLWVVVPLVVICLAGVFYLSEKLWESESWLRKDAFVVYEQFFVWNGESTVEYMVWNVTDLRDGIVDLRLVSHGVNVTNGNVELTLGESGLTMDKATRVVLSGGESVAPYIGDRWPFWIETNVAMGSTIDTWYGPAAIERDERIYVLGQKRKVWAVEYAWASGSMTRWYDQATGVLLKIHNVLVRDGVAIVVTETAVLTSVDLG